jgi:hypothetical protein
LSSLLDMVALERVEAASYDGRSDRDTVAGGLRRVRRRRHPVAALIPFRFYRDGAFWTGCSAYALNRWALKLVVPSTFLRSYANDLWLVPCALPLVLWVHDQMGWRQPGPPSAGEVGAHLVGWSMLFEVVGPYLRASSTGDPWDIVCYAAGGAAAWAWWHRQRWARS